VPTEWLAGAVLEVVSQFGGASYETQKFDGDWRHGGVLHRDNLVRLIVDVPDTAQSREWMKELKGRWKTRLEQVELWMVSPPREKPANKALHRTRQKAARRGTPRPLDGTLAATGTSDLTSG